MIERSIVHSESSEVVTTILPPEYFAKNGFDWVANCFDIINSCAKMFQNSSNFMVLQCKSFDLTSHDNNDFTVTITKVIDSTMKNYLEAKARNRIEANVVLTKTLRKNLRG